MIEKMMMRISESNKNKTLSDKNKHTGNKIPPRQEQVLSKNIKTSKTMTLPSKSVVKNYKKDKNTLSIKDKNKPLKVGPGEAKNKELKPAAKKKQEEGRLRDSMAGWLISDRKKYFEDKISMSKEGQEEKPRGQEYSTIEEGTKKTRRKSITIVEYEGGEEEEENLKLLKLKLLKPVTRKLTGLKPLSDKKKNTSIRDISANSDKNKKPSEPVNYKPCAKNITPSDKIITPIAKNTIPREKKTKFTMTSQELPSIVPRELSVEIPSEISAKRSV